MEETGQNQDSLNKQKQKQLMVVQRQASADARRAPTDAIEHRHQQAKLAALAISFNVRLRSADMPFSMREHALRHARALLDAEAEDAPADTRRRPNPTLLARSLKKEFDGEYGPAWHCVAGKSFGSFVTHSPGGFLYFSVDSLYFLLFKTEVRVVDS